MRKRSPKVAALAGFPLPAFRALASLNAPGERGYIWRGCIWRGDNRYCRIQRGGRHASIC